jgi:tetratricopeptide (TPR) repeat protein
MHRFDQSVEAFQETLKRAPGEIRAYFGAGNAYWDAAQLRLEAGPGAPVAAGAFPEMTVENLLHEAKRNFGKALEMAQDKSERDRIRNAVSNCDALLAKRAGRL